ncbi:GNAT family N-acetyltransferase [Mangrovibrevibacter kandeliae]|uniref:GNAT family N-acetyltransferase n=1 Tax=Mangrovibrevibacter kandeliae TaxID=2968473 RepID=UPI002118F52D|nr:GNAT family N-acetyltransferase [Aurantimonas sp. CSK15Z-1]MCQ8781932.1 GNAT family N-acetyltransferase [Aurantimonas sp. CSK15Z-1]
MKTIAAEVRFAKPSDAGRLAAVHDAAWRGAYTGIIPHRALTRMIMRRNTAWWAEAIGNRAAILALEFDGAAVGYATLGRNRTDALAVEGEIYELYLQPEYQGLGFGRRLFQSARNLLRARGMEGVAVWALADNESACRFYAGSGGIDVAEGNERFDGVTLRKLAYVWQ